jgi:hypothetical protein
MIWPAPTNAYVDALNVHCALPKSAAFGWMVAAGADTPARYKFHQPVRSETKCNCPPGDHSG